MDVCSALNTILAESSGWVTDSARLLVVTQQLQEVLSFVNSNVFAFLFSVLVFPRFFASRHSSSLFRSLFYPSQGVRLFLSVHLSTLLSASNSQTVFQCIMECYCLPLLLQDPQTVSLHPRLTSRPFHETCSPRCSKRFL